MFYPEPGQDPETSMNRLQHFYSTPMGTSSGISNQGSDDDQQGLKPTQTRAGSSWNVASPAGQTESGWNPRNNNTVYRPHVDMQPIWGPAAHAASAVEIKPKVVPFDEPMDWDSQTVLPTPIEEHPSSQGLDALFPGYQQQHMGSPFDFSGSHIAQSWTMNTEDWLRQYPDMRRPSWDGCAKRLPDRYLQPCSTTSGHDSADGNANHYPILPQTNHGTEGLDLDGQSILNIWRGTRPFSLHRVTQNRRSCCR